jgi:hypothetical protein
VTERAFDLLVLFLAMTLRNYTIDNISPLISYSPAGAWKEGEAELDDLTSMSVACFILTL